MLIRNVYYVSLFSVANLFLALSSPQTEEEIKCPEINSTQFHSNTDLLLQLADSCRYDRWTRPGSKDEPLKVHTRIYVYFLGSIEAHNLHLTSKKKISCLNEGDEVPVKNCAEMNFCLQSFYAGAVTVTTASVA